MTETKLKVLHLPEWYPKKNAPFLGIFVRKHIHAIHLFCNNAVLSVSSDENLKDKNFDIDKNYENEILTVRVYYKKVKTMIPVISHFLKLYRHLRSLGIGYTEIKKQFGKPDLTHIHIISHLNFLALFLKNFKNIPFFITEHWSGYLQEDGAFKSFFQKQIAKIMVRNASGVTTVSNALKQAMLNTHGLKNNYFVIPNIVETITCAELKETINDKINIIVVCDLMDEVKNVSGIIKAAAIVYKENPVFILHIIGDGKDRKMLESLAMETGLLNKQIIFYGEINNHEVYEKMLNSDFLILNSHYENFPCVILEAFSCGIPVIATKVGGVPEIIHEENGILIEKNNTRQLQEAIKYMIDNYQKYNKQKLNQFAQTNFTYEVVGKKFFEIYKSVLTKK